MNKKVLLFLAGLGFFIIMFFNLTIIFDNQKSSDLSLCSIGLAFAQIEQGERLGLPKTTFWTTDEYCWESCAPECGMKYCHHTMYWLETICLPEGNVDCTPQQPVNWYDEYDCGPCTE